MGKVRIVLGAILVCLAAAAVDAEPVYRINFRGDPSIDWREPDGNSVGEDCFSNCGEGCSDDWNPCDGRPQYWTQEMLADPQYDGQDYYTDCDVRFGTLWIHTADRYVAPMRETYHGFSTAGCQLHDNTCAGGWWNPGCWWLPHFSCNIDRENKDWSWTTWRDGRIWRSEAIECGCPVQGDYVCW
jgi:hypothetical protein